jgi:hypothetical protein
MSVIPEDFEKQVVCTYVADGEVDWQCLICQDWKSSRDFRKDWTTFEDLCDVMIEHWAHYHRDSA